MSEQGVTKAIVSVTEMARMCGLSRARFYQLTNEGVFPQPSRNETTNRPYYDRQQQEQCLMIRRTNKGANGKVVMFYGIRLERRPKSPTPPSARKRTPRKPERSESDSVVADLRHGLAQLGLAGVDDARVRQTLTQICPEGHADTDEAEVLREVFVRLSEEKT